MPSHVESFWRNSKHRREVMPTFVLLPAIAVLCPIYTARPDPTQLDRRVGSDGVNRCHKDSRLPSTTDLRSAGCSEYWKTDGPGAGLPLRVFSRSAAERDSSCVYSMVDDRIIVQTAEDSRRLLPTQFTPTDATRQVCRVGSAV